MFRFKQFLQEGRLDFIKSQNASVDTSHDALAKHRDVGAIIDHFAQHADPTSNKKYTQWVVGQYKQKHIRQEDAPRVHDALANLEKYGRKMGSPSITSFKHISELEGAIEPHLGKAVSNKEEKRSVKHEGAELIHDGKDLTVHKLKTKEAACLYGKGTKWCTAADKNNQFDHYNELGPLHVATNKHTGEKHQLHFETSQFMDEKDRAVDLSDLVKKNPELKDVEQFRNSSVGYHFARNKQEFHDKIGTALKDENPEVRALAIQHPNTTTDHISTALKDKDVYVRFSATRNPNTTVDQLSTALKDKHPSVREVALDHPNTTTDHISTALKDKDWLVRRTAAYHPKATADHRSAALKDRSVEVRQAAIQHPNATAEHISTALKDEDKRIRQVATMHPNATTEHISTALNDDDPFVRMTATNHLKTTSEHISKAQQDDNVKIRRAAIRNPRATASHITTALKDSDETVRRAAINHPNVTVDHISAALKDSDESVREAAAEVAARRGVDNG